VAGWLALVKFFFLAAQVQREGCNPSPGRFCDLRAMKNNSLWLHLSWHLKQMLQ